MAASTIHVNYKDGSPARGVRVALSFGGLFGGTTTAVYTDNYGRAVVQHSSTGKATIYVSGANAGTFHAPGTAAATI